MIAKTTLGNDFEGALTYGAGLRPGRKQAKAELLLAANVREGPPQRMAQEMRQVAGSSSRIQKPVWHTSLSWPPGEQVSRAQKLRAAERYCELIGASVERHQVVVFEHHDKPHEHVHIYLNRVPVDGGAALRTDNNFYRQPGICRQISQELGLQPLPERRRSVRDLDPTKQAARERVRQALGEVVAATKGEGLDWLTTQLRQRGIGVRFTHDAQGTLRGVSFEADGVGATGQEVGYPGARLRDLFTQAHLLAQAAKQSIPTEQRPRPQRGPRR